MEKEGIDIKGIIGEKGFTEVEQIYQVYDVTESNQFLGKTKIDQKYVENKLGYLNMLENLYSNFRDETLNKFGFTLLGKEIIKNFENAFKAQTDQK